MAPKRDEHGMRDVDRHVFRHVAFSLKIWILVRKTNTDSLKYVGLPDYTPKPIGCKAKTADFNVEPFRVHPLGTATCRGWYELAGLVVDPTKFPKGALPYKSNKVEKALKSWKDFTVCHPLTKGSQYWVQDDPTSKHYGCVMLQRDGYKYIHGDYDLKDVVEVGCENWNLALGEKRRTPGEEQTGENPEGTLNIDGLLVEHDLQKIIDLLNRGIGVDMVQHGYEAPFDAHQPEPINVFGPNGEEVVLKDRAAVESFYFWKFKGRKAGKIIYGGAGEVTPVR